MSLIHYNYHNNNMTHCYLLNELHAKTHLLHVYLLLCIIKLKSYLELICYHLCINKITKHKKYFYTGLRLCWKLTNPCKIATRVLRWRYWRRQAFVLTQRHTCIRQQQCFLLAVHGKLVLFWKGISGLKFPCFLFYAY